MEGINDELAELAQLIKHSLSVITDDENIKFVVNVELGGNGEVENDMVFGNMNEHEIINAYKKTSMALLSYNEPEDEVTH